jgi:outer membrane protein assembly factor BamA
MRSAVLVPLMLAVSLHAQQAASKLWKLTEVMVEGSAFPTADVLAASGLKLQQQADSASFAAAAKRLSDTGRFATVQYEFAPLNDYDVKATFNIQDNKESSPVLFDNFPWWQSDQLMQALHQRVPLFNGTVPFEGTTDEEVRQALSAVLKESGHPSDVELLRRGANVDYVLYRATAIAVTVHGVKFSGASGASADELKARAQKFDGKAFELHVLDHAAVDSFHDALLERGFVQAKVGPPLFHIVKDSPAAPEVEVDFPIEQGQQYTAAGIEWSGNEHVPASELNNFVKVRAHQRTCSRCGGNSTMPSGLTSREAIWRRISMLCRRSKAPA